MKNFRDNKDREWTVSVNVTTVKRVKDLLDVDLMTLVAEDANPTEHLLYRLYTDPVLLCDVVYVVCKPDADSQGVSDEDFGKAMAGDAIDRATAALLEEIVNFSPNPRDRSRLRRVLETTATMLDKAQDLLDRRLDTELESGKLEHAMEEAISVVGS